MKISNHLSSLALIVSMSLPVFVGCAAPVESEGVARAASALDEPKVDPELDLILKYAGKADVIYVNREASNELAKKLLEAGGALELEGGVAAQGLKGKLEGKFKADDLKGLMVKKEKIIVILQLGTGADAAKELFKNLTGDIDKMALEKMAGGGTSGGGDSAGDMGSTGGGEDSMDSQPAAGSFDGASMEGVLP